MGRESPNCLIQISVVLMKWKLQIKTKLSSREINILLAHLCLETEIHTHYMLRQIPQLYNQKTKPQNKMKYSKNNFMSINIGKRR